MLLSDYLHRHRDILSQCDGERFLENYKSFITGLVNYPENQLNPDDILILSHSRVAVTPKSITMTRTNEAGITWRTIGRKIHIRSFYIFSVTSACSVVISFIAATPRQAIHGNTAGIG